MRDTYLQYYTQVKRLDCGFIGNVHLSTKLVLKEQEMPMSETSYSILNQFVII